MSVLRRLIRQGFELLAPQQSTVQVAQPLYRQVATYRFFDWLAGIPDPDEVLRRTGRQRQDLRELLRDSEVSQAIDTRREAVIATPWHLEPEARGAARFVAEELTPHMPRLISGAFDAVLYGYSVLEAVYIRRGARVGVAAIHQPPFEWFRPLPNGELRFFPETGEGGATGIACDPRKFLLAARNPTYRNPYGEALLSVLYWPVTWRLQGWTLWLDFLDTFGAPIVIGKTPSYDSFVTAMQAQGVRRVVAWQQTQENESVDTITASQAGEFERLNSALERSIQRVVLGQTLTSDVGKSGSYAAAQVHNEVRDDKRRADIRLVVAVVQQLIGALWSINGFPGMAPTFCMQDDVGLEKERADRDAVLAEKLGVRFKPAYVAQAYGFEEDDFEIPEPVALPAPGAPASGAGPEDDQLAAKSTPRFTPQQQVIEREVAELLDGEVGPGVDLDGLRSAIRGAKDPADLEARLLTLLDEDDGRFADLLSRAHFAATVLGYVHAAEEA
jgi:phage gp29-like protein